jgi:outer membrane protein assembly factor BamD
LGLRINMLDMIDRFLRLAAVVLLAVTLAACASSDEAADQSSEATDQGGEAAATEAADTQVPTEPPVEQLYNNAMDTLISGDRKAAATQFEEVERQHPYSVWATKAQLMAAYALYQNEDYDDAIIALDRYIQLHPGNRDVSYAYYLKALAYYRQITDVGRDQAITEKALNAFQEIVRRFPNSDYARDSRHKIDLIVDHLAGKEMEVGRYYERRGDYLAAINRFKIVVDKYDTTTHVPEALHRLIESYTALGLDDNARRVAAVLGYNYPGSAWYFDSYELVEGVEVEGKPRDIEQPSKGLDWLY